MFHDDQIVILRKFWQLFNRLRLLSDEAWAESTGQLGASWTVCMFSPAQRLKVCMSDLLIAINYSFWTNKWVFASMCQLPDELQPCPECMLYHLLQLGVFFLSYLSFQWTLFLHLASLLPLFISWLHPCYSPHFPLVTYTISGLASGNRQCLGQFFRGITAKKGGKHNSSNIWATNNDLELFAGVRLL